MGDWRDHRMGTFICHYVSMHAETNLCETVRPACGRDSALDWIKDPTRYNEHELAVGFLTQYRPCCDCLTSKTLENDLLEKELGRE